MRFPYQEYAVDPAPGFGDTSVLYRPEVPVRVFGTAGDAVVFALLDTGADGTLLPRYLGEAVGARIDDKRTSRARGVEGSEFQVAAGEIELELTQDGETYYWSTAAGFVSLPGRAEETPILGHAGCLDFFHVTFAGDARELEIVPVDSFPGKVTPPPE